MDAEAAFIADNLDIPFTTEKMNRYIRTHHTENPDFAKNIPTSFTRLVDYDRALAAAFPNSPVNSAATCYIALFQHFGYALISAEGTRALPEIAAYYDYINALRYYQESATENAPSAE